MNTSRQTHYDTRSSDEIKQDIRNVRSNMDTTLDRLSDKLNVRNIIDDLLMSFTSDGDPQSAEAVKNGARKAANFVRENPIPTAVTGAGLAWIAAEMNRPPRSQRKMESFQSDIEPHHVSTDNELSADSLGVAEQAGQKLLAAKESLTEATSDLKSSTAQTYQSVSGRISATGSSATSQTTQALRISREKFSSAKNDFPLAVGLGFLGLGLLAGIAAPGSRREDELLGEQSDQVIDSLKTKGENIAQKGKDIASNTADHVVEKAEEKGLTIDSLQSSAATLKEEATAIAKSAAEEAKQKARTEKE